MELLYDSLNAWFWFGCAALLLIIELLTGTGFLLCLGVSSGLMSIIVFFMGILSPNMQILLFSLFAILSLVYWCFYLKVNPNYDNRPKLNKRAERYIGLEFTLHENIVNGMGKIQVEDSVWLVRSREYLPADTAVTVTGVDGTILIIGKSKKH